MWRTNLEDREELVRQTGESAFLGNPAYEHLRDIAVPPYYAYEWSIYLEIRRLSGEYVTWETVASWCRVRDTVLTQAEVDAVIRIHGYAEREIRRLRDESRAGCKER